MRWLDAGCLHVTMVDRDPSVRAWRLISDLVKSLSTLLLRCLPDFWRLSKAFIEGKFAHKVRAWNGGE